MFFRFCLSILWFELCCGFLTENILSENKNFPASKQGLNDLRNYLEIIKLEVNREFDEGLDNLQRALEYSSKRQSKRSLTIGRPAHFQKVDTESLPKVIQEFKNISVHSIAVENVNNELFVIVSGKFRFPADNTYIWLWNNTKKQLQLFASFMIHGAIDIETFSINGKLYLIATLNERADLKDPFVRKTQLFEIRRNSTIVIQNFLTVASTKWKTFKFLNSLYLVQASYLKFKDRKRLNRKCLQERLKASKSVEVYQWKEFGFKKVQTISGSYVTDLEICKIQSKTFLIVANQRFSNVSRSSVFVYEIVADIGGKINFQLFQDLPAFSPRDINCFHAENSYFLTIANEYRIVSKQRFYETESSIFRFNGLFFAAYQQVKSIGAVKWNSFRLQSPERPIFILHLRSRDSQSQQFILSQKKWESANFPVLDTAQIICMIKDDFYIISRPSIAVLEWKHNTLTFDHSVNNLKNNFNSLFQRLEDNVSKLKTLKDRFRNVDTAADKSSILKTLLPFENKFNESIVELERRPLAEKIRGALLTFRIEELTVDNLNVQQLMANNMQVKVINNVNFSQFVDEVVKVIPKSENKLLMNRHRFKNIRLEGEVTLTGTLNSFPFQSFAVLNRSNIFLAPKTIGNLIVDDSVFVNGVINGHPSYNFLLKFGDQQLDSDLVIEGDVQMHNLRVKSGIVDGVDWNLLTKSVQPTDKQFRRIEGNVNFTSDIATDELIVTGLINGIDVTDLRRSVLTIDKFNYHPKLITWKSLEVLSDVMVESTIINNYIFPDQFIRLNSKTWTIPNSVFKDVVSDSLFVRGSVNGLDFPVDILMSDGVQTIEGRKHMSYLRFGNISTLNGNPNAKPRIYIDKLKVKNIGINGLMYPNIIKLRSTVYNVYDDVYCHTAIFESAVEVPDGSKWSSSITSVLVPIRIGDAMAVHIASMNTAKFLNSVVVKGPINGVYIEELLAQSVCLFRNRQITNRLIFADKIITNSLETSFVQGNGFEFISNNSGAFLIVQRDILFDSIFADEIFIFGSLSNVNLVDFFNDTLLSGVEQYVFGSKKIKGNLNIIKNNIATDNFKINDQIEIKGKNIKQLFRDAVLVDNALTFVHSELEFIQSVEIQHLLTDMVDGIKIHDLLYGSLLINESRSLILYGNLKSKAVYVSHLNNFTIDNFLLNVAQFGQLSLPRHIKFEKVVVNKNLLFSGTINGIKASELVSVTDKVVTFTNSKWFNGFVHVCHNISAKRGLIIRSHSIEENYFVNRLIIEGNLHVSNYLDGVLWNSFLENSFSGFENKASINCKTHFSKIILENELSITGLLNNISLQHMVKNMVTVDQPCILHGKISFKNSTLFSKALFFRNFTRTKLHNTGIQKRISIGTLKFVGPVIVMGSISANFSSSRTFQIKKLILNILELDGLFAKVDIANWNLNSIKLNEPIIYINSLKSFELFEISKTAICNFGVTRRLEKEMEEYFKSHCNNNSQKLIFQNVEFNNEVIIENGIFTRDNCLQRNKLEIPSGIIGAVIDGLPARVETTKKTLKTSPFSFKYKTVKPKYYFLRSSTLQSSFPFTFKPIYSKTSALSFKDSFSSATPSAPIENITEEKSTKPFISKAVVKTSEDLSKFTTGIVKLDTISRIKPRASTLIFGGNDWNIFTTTDSQSKSNVFTDNTKSYLKEVNLNIDSTENNCKLGLCDIDFTEQPVDYSISRITTFDEILIGSSSRIASPNFVIKSSASSGSETLLSKGTLQTENIGTVLTDEDDYLHPKRKPLTTEASIDIEETNETEIFLPNIFEINVSMNNTQASSDFDLFSMESDNGTANTMPLFLTKFATTFFDDMDVNQSLVSIETVRPTTENILLTESDEITDFNPTRFDVMDLATSLDKKEYFNSTETEFSTVATIVSEETALNISERVTEFTDEPKYSMDSKENSTETIVSGTIVTWPFTTSAEMTSEEMLNSTKTLEKSSSKFSFISTGPLTTKSEIIGDKVVQDTNTTTPSLLSICENGNCSISTLKDIVSMSTEIITSITDQDVSDSKIEMFMSSDVMESLGTAEIFTETSRDILKRSQSETKRRSGEKFRPSTYTTDLFLPKLDYVTIEKDVFTTTLSTPIDEQFSTMDEFEETAKVLDDNQTMAIDISEFATGSLVITKETEPVDIITTDTSTVQLHNFTMAEMQPSTSFKWVDLTDMGYSTDSTNAISESELSGSTDKSSTAFDVASSIYITDFKTSVAVSMKDLISNVSSTTPKEIVGEKAKASTTKPTTGKSTVAAIDICSNHSCLKSTEKMSTSTKVPAFPVDNEITFEDSPSSTLSDFLTSEIESFSTENQPTILYRTDTTEKTSFKLGEASETFPTKITEVLTNSVETLSTVLVDISLSSKLADETLLPEITKVTLPFEVTSTTFPSEIAETLLLTESSTLADDLMSSTNDYHIQTTDNFSNEMDVDLVTKLDNSTITELIFSTVKPQKVTAELFPTTVKITSVSIADVTVSKDTTASEAFAIETESSSTILDMQTEPFAVSEVISDKAITADVDFDTSVLGQTYSTSSFVFDSEFPTYKSSFETKLTSDDDSVTDKMQSSISSLFLDSLWSTTEKSFPQSTNLDDDISSIWHSIDSSRVTSDSTVEMDSTVCDSHGDCEIVLDDSSTKTTTISNLLTEDSAATDEMISVSIIQETENIKTVLIPETTTKSWPVNETSTTQGKIEGDKVVMPTTKKSVLITSSFPLRNESYFNKSSLLTTIVEESITDLTTMISMLEITTGAVDETTRFEHSTDEALLSDGTDKEFTSITLDEMLFTESTDGTDKTFFTDQSFNIPSALTPEITETSTQSQRVTFVPEVSTESLSSEVTAKSLPTEVLESAFQFKITETIPESSGTDKIMISEVTTATLLSETTAITSSLQATVEISKTESTAETLLTEMTVKTLPTEVTEESLLDASETVTESLVNGSVPFESTFEHLSTIVTVETLPDVVDTATISEVNGTVPFQETFEHLSTEVTNELPLDASETATESEINVSVPFEATFEHFSTIVTVETLPDATFTATISEVNGTVPFEVTFKYLSTGETDESSLDISETVTEFEVNGTVPHDVTFEPLSTEITSEALTDATVSDEVIVQSSGSDKTFTVTDGAMHSEIISDATAKSVFDTEKIVMVNTTESASFTSGLNETAFFDTTLINELFDITETVSESFDGVSLYITDVKISSESSLSTDYLATDVSASEKITLQTESVAYEDVFNASPETNIFTGATDNFETSDTAFTLKSSFITELSQTTSDISIMRDTFTDKTETIDAGFKTDRFFYTSTLTFDDLADNETTPEIISRNDKSNVTKATVGNVVGEKAIATTSKSSIGSSTLLCKICSKFCKNESCEIETETPTSEEFSTYKSPVLSTSLQEFSDAESIDFSSFTRITGKEIHSLTESTSVFESSVSGDDLTTDSENALGQSSFSSFKVSLTDLTTDSLQSVDFVSEDQMTGEVTYSSSSSHSDNTEFTKIQTSSIDHEDFTRTSYFSSTLIPLEKFSEVLGTITSFFKTETSEIRATSINEKSTISYTDDRITAWNDTTDTFLPTVGDSTTLTQTFPTILLQSQRSTSKDFSEEGLQSFSDTSLETHPASSVHDLTSLDDDGTESSSMFSESFFETTAATVKGIEETLELTISETKTTKIDDNLSTGSAKLSSILFSESLPTGTTLETATLTEIEETSEFSTILSFSAETLITSSDASIESQSDFSIVNDRFKSSSLLTSESTIVSESLIDEVARSSITASSDIFPSETSFETVTLDVGLSSTSCDSQSGCEKVHREFTEETITDSATEISTVTEEISSIKELKTVIIPESSIKTYLVNGTSTTQGILVIDKVVVHTSKKPVLNESTSPSLNITCFNKSCFLTPILEESISELSTIDTISSLSEITEQADSSISDLGGWDTTSNYEAVVYSQDDSRTSTSRMTSVLFEELTGSISSLTENLDSLSLFDELKTSAIERSSTETIITEIVTTEEKETKSTSIVDIKFITATESIESVATTEDDFSSESNQDFEASTSEYSLSYSSDAEDFVSASSWTEISDDETYFTETSSTKTISITEDDLLSESVSIDISTKVSSETEIVSGAEAVVTTVYQPMTYTEGDQIATGTDVTDEEFERIPTSTGISTESGYTPNGWSEMDLVTLARSYFESLASTFSTAINFVSDATNKIETEIPTITEQSRIQFLTEETKSSEFTQTEEAKVEEILSTSFQKHIVLTLTTESTSRSTDIVNNFDLTTEEQSTSTSEISDSPKTHEVSTQTIPIIVVTDSERSETIAIELEPRLLNASSTSTLSNGTLTVPGKIIGDKVVAGSTTQTSKPACSNESCALATVDDDLPLNTVAPTKDSLTISKDEVDMTVSDLTSDVAISTADTLLEDIKTSNSIVFDFITTRDDFVSIASNVTVDAELAIDETETDLIWSSTGTGLKITSTDFTTPDYLVYETPEAIVQTEILRETAKDVDIETSSFDSHTQTSQHEPSTKQNDDDDDVDMITTIINYFTLTELALKDYSGTASKQTSEYIAESTGESEVRETDNAITIEPWNSNISTLKINFETDPNQYDSRASEQSSESTTTLLNKLDHDVIISTKDDVTTSSLEAEVTMTDIEVDLNFTVHSNDLTSTANPSTITNIDFNETVATTIVGRAVSPKIVKDVQNDTECISTVEPTVDNAVANREGEDDYFSTIITTEDTEPVTDAAEELSTLWSSTEEE